MRPSIPVLGLSFTLFTSASLASNLIGSIRPFSLDSWNATQAICVADCSHIIGVLKQANQPPIVYLSEILPNIKSKLLFWKITDQLPYVTSGTGLEVVYGVCENNEQLDLGIVAVLKPSDTEWLTNIRTAYRANTESGRFETITTYGIRCQNLNWGIDRISL